MPFLTLRLSPTEHALEEAYAATAKVAAEGIGEHGRPERLRQGDTSRPVFRVNETVLRLELHADEQILRIRLDACRELRRGGVPFVAVREPGLLWCATPVPTWVTMWKYQQPKPPLDWAAFGAAVRQLHEQPPGELVRLRTGPVDLDVAAREFPGLDSAALDGYVSVAESLLRAQERLGWHDLPVTTVHGDLWTKNVIPLGEGRVALCDFEFLRGGAAALDLGFVKDETAEDERWSEFASAYGPTPEEEHCGLGLLLGYANWATFVLTHRREWRDYINLLAAQMTKLTAKHLRAVS